MNLKEMVGLCAVLMGANEKIADDNAIKTTDEQNLYDKLVHGINAAYRMIARDIWRPVFTDRVRLDGFGRVSIKSLSRTFVQLTGATDSNGKTLACRERKEYIYLAAQPGTAVEISYYYVPEPLILPLDEPILPDGKVDTRAYIYYALSLYYMSENRYSEARAWELRFRSVTDNISESRGRRFLPMRRWF